MDIFHPYHPFTTPSTRQPFHPSTRQPLAVESEFLDATNSVPWHDAVEYACRDTLFHSLSMDTKSVIH